MRYKKFLIDYKEEVVGHLPNGDEIISEMDDLAEITMKKWLVTKDILESILENK